MIYWHGYVLIEKPAVLTMLQWRTVVLALADVLGRQDQASQPAQRLHYRRRLDDQAVIVEACFDVRDLDPEDLSRLCTYVSNALGGAYTPQQVRDALRDNVTVAGAGGRWRQSRDLVAAYLQANAAEWDSADV